MYQALIKSLPRLITRLFTTRSLAIFHRPSPSYLLQHKAAECLHVSQILRLSTCGPFGTLFGILFCFFYVSAHGATMECVSQPTLGHLFGGFCRRGLNWKRYKARIEPLTSERILFYIATSQLRIHSWVYIGLSHQRWGGLCRQ